MHAMNTQELLRRAVLQADALGQEPVDWRQRKQWREDRRGAVMLLASLAEWDGALLRNAALETASEWSDRAAIDLLLDAAQQC
jgi:hypothetical protein